MQGPVSRNLAGPPQELVYARIYNKNAARAWEPCNAHFVQARAVEGACDKSHLCEHLQDKCRAPRAGPLLCASLRNWNVNGHVNRVTRAILSEKLQEKCRAPWSPESLKIGTRGRAVCASLRGQNAHGHVWRAIWCENLQEKCRSAVEMHMDTSQIHKSHVMPKFTWKTPPPWTNSGLTSYRKNPSEWTHCLGKMDEGNLLIREKQHLPWPSWSRRAGSQHLDFSWEFLAARPCCNLYASQMSGAQSHGPGLVAIPNKLVFGIPLDGIQ